MGSNPCGTSKLSPALSATLDPRPWIRELMNRELMNRELVNRDLMNVS